MKKKEYIILAVIIVLLGGYLFLRSADRSRYELPVLESVESSDITRIEITTTGQTIDLSRSGDQWQIGDKAYPADTAKVNDMLSELEELKLTALVSETGAYSPYDLTDDKKIDVRAWSGDLMVRNLSIGKTANTYQHTFVRLGQDPDVYHADGSFRETFDKSVDSLRDKTALSFTVGNITGIDIVSAGKQISLSRIETSATAEEASGETVSAPPAPEPVWMMDDDTPADEEAVQRILSQLAYLNCSGYLESRQKADFSSPVSTITLKGEDNYSLSLFEQGIPETGCPAISSQNPYPFTLSETACKRLAETLDAILGGKVEADAAESESKGEI